MQYRLLICLLLVLGYSGSAYAQKTTPEEYIAKYKDLAVDEMKRSGVPASITLAQGLLESANGNSYLAREANNHFGIKCKSTWTGRTVKADDDAQQECFRAYDKVEDSYRDHSDFLRGNVRYAVLFQLEPKDYKGWAQGLKDAGYATNPKYADLLIAIIERYQLDQYDSGERVQWLADKDDEKPKKKGKKGKDKEPKEEVKIQTFNNIPIYVVQRGENWDEVAQKLGMMRWQLPKYNDLDKEAHLLPGTILYLKPKNRKAEMDFHTVQPGEDMYYISQKHAIKLKNLLKYNLMKDGQEPKPGEKLHLREKREKPPKLRVNGAAGFVVRTPLMENDQIKKKNEESKVQPKKPVAQATPGVNPTEQPKQASEQTVGNTVQETEAPIDEEINDAEAGDEEIMASSATTPEPEDEHNPAADPQTGEAPKALYKPAPVTAPPPSNIPPSNPVGTGTPTVTAEAKTTPAPATPPTANKPVPNVPATTQIHTVAGGQTLYSISRMYGTTVDNLKKWNGLADNSISVGQQLKVSAPSATASTSEEPVKAEPAVRIYTVKAGDTLYSIARAHGVTVAQIQSWNKIPGTGIQVGQKLEIK